MDILKEILSALESEDHVLLATIISTSGSTPASAFSKMVVKDGGKSWTGTIGGGCMESDVLQQAIRLYDTSTAEIQTFHLNEDNLDQGLICGGSLDVLLEPIRREHIPLLQQMKLLRDEGNDCIVVTTFDGGGESKSKVVMPVSPGENQAGKLPPDMTAEVLKAYQRNEIRRLKYGDGERIIEPVMGHPHLVIFGGGHVSKYVSRAAAMAGFRTSIVDDRKDYANAARFPEAYETLAVEFYEAFDRITITPSTYILIVTRGHRSDEDILERAVQSPARYIGMIGSKKKVLTSYEHLVEKGIAVDALRRVHAPMGLEIGAVTAEEIAISIVAEIVLVRRGAQAPAGHKSGVMSELVEKLRKKP